MEIPKIELQYMLAYEAFIRRASEVNMPFMLKGSYVTRQYFKDPSNRLPGDVDWVYLDPLFRQQEADNIFDEWLCKVTELEMFDDVNFRSFKENAFFRRIDYAMAEDFPTVNTDLWCWVDGEELDSLFLDISFNLDVEAEPVPLLYKPLRGKPFTIPHTAPLCLQVSWKLHQTLVRPRFKDIFDLIHLLQHPDFDSNMLQLSLQALVNECNADNIDNKRLNLLLSGQLEKLFLKNSVMEVWDFWRHKRRGVNLDLMYSDRYAEDITDVSLLPYNFSVFKDSFMEALSKAGFHPSLIDDLPASTKQLKQTVKQPAVTEIRKHTLTPQSKPKQQSGLFSFLSRLFR